MFRLLGRKTVSTLHTLYRSVRGVDYKILNSHIVKMNNLQDIDSIIYQAAQCLYYILDYDFFAFAFYDKEFNGGLDVWINPKIGSMSIVNFIKKDFADHNTYCNIHHFDHIATSGSRNGGLSTIRLDDVTTITIMDKQTRAMLYILPRRKMLRYHKELLRIITETLSTALNNFLNLKKLENAALIDPLTHCYNRRALDEYIGHDIASAERYGSDLSVVMFDIDHFKGINDTYGHTAGDAVLRAVSKSVLAAIRKSDYLARIGGEEFLLVLVDTTFSKAIELAERLRQIVENLKVNLGDNVVNVTASFGVAVYKKGIDRALLFEKADEMLYKAKREGRNRIKPDLRLYRTGFDPSVSTEKSFTH